MLFYIQRIIEMGGNCRPIFSLKLLFEPLVYNLVFYPPEV
jgi:hypothetical protein